MEWKFTKYVNADSQDRKIKDINLDDLDDNTFAEYGAFNGNADHLGNIWTLLNRAFFKLQMPPSNRPSNVGTYTQTRARLVMTIYDMLLMELDIC